MDLRNARETYVASSYRQRGEYRSAAQSRLLILLLGRASSAIGGQTSS